MQVTSASGAMSPSFFRAINLKNRVLISITRKRRSTDSAFVELPDALLARFACVSAPRSGSALASPGTYWGLCRFKPNHTA